MNYIKFSSNQKEIIEIYLELYLENKVRPTVSDLKSEGISRDRIRSQFGNMTKLIQASKIYNPKFYEKIFDDSKFLTDEYFNNVKKKISKYKKFIITTAVSCCSVNKKFLKSVDTYCQKNNAILLIIPVYDTINQLSQNFDPILIGRNIVSKELKLNSNIVISDIKISPRTVDPITSLDRVGNRNYSFIYGSPKQRLVYVPTEYNKYPLAIMTSGSITESTYINNSYKNNKNSYIANDDHLMGGIIVEIIDDKFFHFRQIQMDDSGGFHDLDKYYCGNSVRKSKASVFVLGDYHSGQTDLIADKCFKEVIKYVGVEKLVIHDVFDGLSICHHDKHKMITQAKKANANKLNLKNEIKKVSEDLNILSKLVKNIVITKSNHDEFLEKYLQECRFRDDPENFEFSLELALEMVRGNDPLKYAVETQGLKNQNNIKWLKRNESFKLFGIEFGDHGDKGSNGSYGGNLKQLEKSYGKSVSGHTHVPEILRGSFRVGTTSLLNLEYVIGLSSWMHTSCLIFSNGNRQLINIIDGKWKI